MGKRRRRTGSPRAVRTEIVEPREGADLCLSCGMCCDGTLFSSGALLDREVDLARSLGMELFQSTKDAGVFKFRQPCACFREGSCAVYDQAKPAVCTTYRCELLKGYTAGTIDLDSCVDVVGWMQGLMHQLEAEMGLAFGTFTYWHLVTYVLTVRPHEQPERYERFLLSCRRYLDMGHRLFGFPLAELEAIVADDEDAPASA
jgi:hypothetical protein